MRFKLVIVLMVWPMGCNAGETTVDPMVLVQNEQAFGADAAANGMRGGFLAHIADDGVLFIPQAVNGKAHYEAAEKSPGLLTWTPIYAEISSGGDLGWTTGPWDWRAATMADTPQVSGHYVTIWKLQPDSTWKFVFDMGVAHNPHPSPPPPPALKVLDRPDAAGDLTLNQARYELGKLERVFTSASASQGLVAAYAVAMANDIRLYRMGEFPIQGVSAVAKALSLVDGTWTWAVNHAEVSPSGDLGYTFGVSTLAVNGTEAQFSFAHIWRRAENGEWQLALDIHIPLPPPAPAEEETGG